jgi:hypothetical protein
MTLRKFIKIVGGLFLTFVIAVGLTSINHPIVLKWLTGSARIIGRPINATVYTNGQINNEIKVFHVDKYWNGNNADYFILNSSFVPANKKLKFFSINRKDNYVGRPSSTNVRDYDIIAGLLLQSEVGGKFTPFGVDMKGYNFDTKLTFIDKKITLKIPPSGTELKCDSIRVEL